MVQMKNVTMVYGKSTTAALDDISLSIDEGEFVFLVGPCGSGKTTIIKLLTGEIKASEGEIIVNGFDMNEIRPRKMPKMRRTLGVIFQDFRLIEKIGVYLFLYAEEKRTLCLGFFVVFRDIAFFTVFIHLRKNILQFGV